MGTARRPPSSLGGQKPLTITEREKPYFVYNDNNIIKYYHMNMIHHLNYLLTTSILAARLLRTGSPNHGTMRTIMYY